MRIITVLLLSIVQCYSIAQEHETVLDAPDNWQKEIIPFPISFAPEIDLEGFEDLRFTPGWSDSTSEEFWAYMFVWYVEESGPLTEQLLTKYFNSYYDGLMRIDQRNEMDSLKTNQLNRTPCRFQKTDDGFSGEMTVYDGFFTKKYMTLNIQVSHTLCASSKKQIIRCDISPKPFADEIWKVFDKVKLNRKC